MKQHRKPAANNKDHDENYGVNRETYFEILPIIKKALSVNQITTNEYYYKENKTIDNNSPESILDMKYGRDAVAKTRIGDLGLALRIQDRRNTSLPFFDSFTVSDKRANKDDFSFNDIWVSDIVKYVRYDEFCIPRMTPDLIVHIEIKGDEMRIWKVVCKPFGQAVARLQKQNKLSKYLKTYKDGTPMEFYTFDTDFMQENKLWYHGITPTEAVRIGQYESWSISKQTMNWYYDITGEKIIGKRIINSTHKD